MDENSLRQQTLQKYREKGIAVVSSEEKDAELTLQSLADGELPPTVDTFFRLWRQSSSDLWQIGRASWRGRV